MTEDQRHIAQEMLASVRAVLRELAQMSREQWMRSGQAQWHVMRAMVVVGTGVGQLFWLLVRYPDPWWWRAERLGYGVRGGRSRFDLAYLWDAIPRDWPHLERKLMQLLDDNPSPVPHP